MPDTLNALTREEIDAIKVAARSAPSALPLLARAGAAAAGAADPIGVVVAEGDSWFDYPPGLDILDLLYRNHAYRIDRFSKAGDSLENMIYGTDLPSLFDRGAPQIEQLLTRIHELQPRVVLFSGGGNDVAGDEFISYLNHQLSPAPGLREEYVEYMFETVFPAMYENLIQRVTDASPGSKIFTHGYAHAIPDGRGVSFIGFNFVGPWLAPALKRKRLLDPANRPDRLFVTAMIDRFNTMLGQVEADHPGVFHHVDVRRLVSDDDWVNELHLSNDAYARVAAAIDARVRAALELEPPAPEALRAVSIEVARTSVALAAEPQGPLTGVRTRPPRPQPRPQTPAARVKRKTRKKGRR